MQEIDYKPQNVCASRIRMKVDKGLVLKVSFEDGCDGNARALERLVEGMKVSEVIDRLKGIGCGGKATSCPDQLARALESLANKPKTSD